MVFRRAGPEACRGTLSERLDHWWLPRLMSTPGTDATARKAAAKSPGKKKSALLSDSARVLKIINRSKKGIDVATLVHKTAIDEKKIRNIIYRAHKDGIIKRAGRGIYLGT